MEWTTSSLLFRKAILEGEFDKLDTDHSGDLDSEELISTLVNECAIEEFFARSLLEDFDLDRNGTIDRDEFMTMWMKLFGWVTLYNHTPITVTTNEL